MELCEDPGSGFHARVCSAMSDECFSLGSGDEGLNWIRHPTSLPEKGVPSKVGRWPRKKKPRDRAKIKNSRLKERVNNPSSNCGCGTNSSHSQITLKSNQAVPWHASHHHTRVNMANQWKNLGCKHDHNIMIITIIQEVELNMSR